MEKITYWKYCLANKIWLFIGLTLIMFGFFAYWILAEGGLYENYDDITGGLIVLGFMWSVYFIGNFIAWCNLDKS